MKHKITILIASLFVTSFVMKAQTTLTVTSSADNGSGTLRNVLNDAASGDSIVIANNITEIALESEIRLVSAKSLKINGQGVIVRVVEPGISRYRVFGFAYEDGESVVALHNLTLKGGNISADIITTENEKGATLFVKRVNLIMKNCTLSSGKANNGGGLADGSGSGSLSLVMEGCTFTDNTATKGSAACALNFLNGISIKNCIFENNKAIVNGGCSAVDIVQTATITNCIFKNNSSITGRSGAALSVRKASGIVTVNNCSFTGNINSGNDGGSAVTKQVDTGIDEGGLVKLINCTFYNNRGGRGAVYIYQGEAIVVNCTFTGNKNGNTDTKYAGAFYAAQDKQTIVRLTNNIMAYNYCMNSTAKDYYVPGGSYCTQYGVKNLIAGGEHIGTKMLIDESFSYGTSSLFAVYTSNNSGDKIPKFDETTGTVPLAANSIAISAGVSTYLTPNIVPTTDLFGVVRNTPPCIGSSEFTAPSGINNLSQKEFIYLSADNALTIFSESERTVQVYNIDGRLVAHLQLKIGKNTFSGLSKGVYLLNNSKIIIR